MSNKFNVAICQMKVGDNKKDNIRRAVEMIKEAALNQANIAVLPEIFNSLYDESLFEANAEPGQNGETLKIIAKLAKELGIYIVAGSILEREEEKIYNASFVFNKLGEVIGKHRKVHLFDIDIPGKITFKESSILSPGNQITVVDTEYCKIGIAICYDIRFPELMRGMTLKGAKLAIVPASFNMTTGPAHWDLLMRGRAVDNQFFLAAASPSRDATSKYVSYGHSMIVDPWGRVMSEAHENQEIIYSEIDIKKVDEIRDSLPLLKHRRTEIYNI